MLSNPEEIKKLNKDEVLALLHAPSIVSVALSSNADVCNKGSVIKSLQDCVASKKLISITEYIFNRFGSFNSPDFINMYSLFGLNSKDILKEITLSQLANIKLVLKQ